MNIPYYQQMGIKNINSVSAFENAIPFIDKDIVRKSWDSFLLPRMVKNKVVEGEKIRCACKFNSVELSALLNSIDLDDLERKRIESS